MHGRGSYIKAAHCKAQRRGYDETALLYDVAHRQSITATSIFYVNNFNTKRFPHE